MVESRAYLRRRILASERVISAFLSAQGQNLIDI